MESQPANAFILNRQSATDWSTFIDYWAKAYDYLAKNSDYDRFVAERDDTFVFDKINLRKLFEWKNKTGDKLTAKKEKTVDRLIDNLPLINQLRKQWDDKLFHTQFGKISAVWQTYLMHIIQPTRFPIFDQHVYRAHVYLRTGRNEELNGTTKQKVNAYQAYRTFFDEVKQASGNSSRDLDKAFWSFGRFIRQYRNG